MSRARQRMVVTNWWPLELRLLSAHRDVLYWASHHLATSVELLDPPLVRLTLRVSVDQVMTESVRREIAVDATDVEPYPGDRWCRGTFERRRAWIRSDCGRDGRKAVALIELAADEWLVVAATAAEAGTAAVRLARELLRTELACRGSYTFHAACACANEVGCLLLAGASRVGKTTLAVGVAQSGYLISGDQTEVLIAAGRHPVAVGFPWSYRVGLGTLHGLGLGRGISRFLLRPQDPQLAETSVPDLVKLELTHLEMAVLGGVPTAAGCELDGVVVMGVEDGLDYPSARVLAPQEAAVQLKAHLREPDPSFGTFWLARPGRRPPETQDPTDLTKLLEYVPIVRLSWDPKRHSLPDTLLCLERCLRSTPASGTDD